MFTNLVLAPRTLKISVLNALVHFADITISFFEVKGLKREKNGFKAKLQ